MLANRHSHIMPIKADIGTFLALAGPSARKLNLYFDTPGQWMMSVLTFYLNKTVAQPT